MSSVKNLTLQDPSKINEYTIFDNESNIFDNESTVFDNESTVFHDIPITTSLTSNLCELLLANVNVPSYNLTPDQIIWINEFIKASPSSFEKITSDIQSITFTGEMQLNNIPPLVKLFADIYYSGAINYNLVNPANIITFIKFTIDVFLTSKLVIIYGVKKEAIQALVDISLTLLSMNITNVTNIETEKETETDIQVIKSSSCFVSFLKILKFN
jgi:hypothetical protein